MTPVQDISFYAGSAANGAFGIPGFRIAVQIEGSWYVSTAVLANTVAVPLAGNFSSGAQKVTFNWTTDASAWNSLNFTPGATLEFGSALSSPLPGGSITGFGLYSDQEAGAGNATRRFDTFQIDAIPEPSSAMLGLAGVGMLMTIRRFRKA
ncbi:MAG: PEP-CTERM sorting domain-containing protein [Limisphaerales bacterium]